MSTMRTRAPARLQATTCTLPDYTPDGRDTSYSFVSPDPVGRWNPCAPISYRVNTTKAPPGVLPDVRAALDQVSQATGLQFDYRGTTSVGLMHIDGDAAQLMSPAIGYGLDQWGAGDLAGLERLGAGGGCLTPGA